MGKRATIKDVAIDAGVSIGTVDRVLHQRGRFSSETEMLVKKSIEKLNYQPSQIASALVTMKKNWQIGVNYPQESDAEIFWLQVDSGVKQAQKELEPFGIEIITDCPDSFSMEAQKESILHLVEKGVNGIVTTAFNSKEKSEKLFNIIPPEIPYATAINRAWSEDYLFHIGPNDEAMGSFIAKLIELYCGKDAKVVIIAPNLEVEGTQKRIGGFLNKITNELDTMQVLQICPIVAKTTSHAYSSIYAETNRLMQQYPEMNALYISNGFVRPAAEAIEESGKKIKIFAHEYFDGLLKYLNNGIISATIYQDPAKQWHDAIMKLADYLRTKSIPPKTINSKCTLITRESFPLTELEL